LEKKVLAIHDISCIGRCSLTVALPIISAAGAETSVLPTAVLSTHTGEFTGYTFRDLTSDIEPIANHWKSLGITFDSIYTGYFGSFKQLKIAGEVIDTFKNEKTLILVDPVMGDHGKLYANFDESFADEFKLLCEKADIITPNLTEASLLLGIPYAENGYDRDYIREILVKLSEIGPEKVVLTGISFDEHELGCATYDSKTKEVKFCMDKKTPGRYYGTGDVLASAMLGAVLCGMETGDAAQTAVSFTARAIERTAESGRNPIYGVDFELGLAEYAMEMKKQRKIMNF